MPDDVPEDAAQRPVRRRARDGNCEVKPEMRCVWVKAYERSERLPLWRGHIDDLRPPVDNALEGHLVVAQPAQRPRPRRRPPAGTADAMSDLERKLAAGEFVVTGEMPVIDGGGLDEVAPPARADGALSSTPFNATDNPSAHAHCSPLAVAIALRERGVEPIMQLTCRDRNRLALAGRPGRRRDARDREHLLPDRRRRDRRRRAARRAACSTSTARS